MKIQDDDESSPDKKGSVFKQRRATHDVGKKSLKSSPRNQPNKLQSIKSMHVN